MTIDEESPLMGHSMEAHWVAPPSFQMKVLKFLKSNLMRKVSEGTRIQEMEGWNLPNRRSEWGQNLPPKLVVDDQIGDVECDTPGIRIC